VVAIANDITYQSGAFGPREDCLFRAATELALEERLPCIYLAANRWVWICLGLRVWVGTGCLLALSPDHKLRTRARAPAAGR
jgi:hypothetical protein